MLNFGKLVYLNENWTISSSDKDDEFILFNIFVKWNDEIIYEKLFELVSICYENTVILF